MDKKLQTITDNLPFSPLDESSTLGCDCDLMTSNSISGEHGTIIDDMTQVKLGKTPKRILHFCDGTIEEYSTDEDDETDSKSATTSNIINPKSLTWGPWFWYHTVMAGSTSLKVCDYLGETLASFFGITTPKYQYEIEEYKRMIAEEEELKTREDLEMGGWTSGTSQAGSGEAIQLPLMTPQRDKDKDNPPMASQTSVKKDYGDIETKTNQRY